jgi:signal transduction histidine kinase
VPNRILPISDPSVYDTVDRIASVSEALFALAALVIVVARWRRASGPARRTLGWVAAAGAVAAAIIAYNRLNTRLLGDFLQSTPTMQIVLNLARMSIPIAAAAVLVRGRRARGRVADLVVDVSAHGLLDSRAQLSRALADPSVQLLRYRPQDGTYRDDQDTAVTPPEGATPLEADGVQLGLLVHDPALREEPELLGSVVAAARLALHNERLTDEVRAQLEHVRESRRRLVEVADEERRRLERDLHDGAQQYLTALNLQAGAAAHRAERLGDDELSAQLRQLAEHASSALNELRSLARGIRPPVLTDLGLAGALEELADRFPLPVTLEVNVGGRLDDVVEATAYFAVAEGMTNVVKYAEASRVFLSAKATDGALVLRVSDDGRGGATPAGGTGLLGLRDRLEALGGTLTIESPPGAGTTLLARIPFAPVAPPPDQSAEVARR